MSYKFEEELTQLAKNIESVITNSLESVELNKAKEQVNSAMDHAIDEVRKALDQAGTKLDQSLERNKKKSAGDQKRRGRIGDYAERRLARRIPDISRMTPSQLLRYSKIPVTRNPAGRTSGAVYAVLGISGLVVFGLSLLTGIAAVVATGLSSMAAGALLFLGGLTVGSGLLTSRGFALRNRVKRFYRYLRIINNRTYCDVKEIISSQGEEPKVVMKDLKTMIRLGMFREGHLDETGSTLMLTDATYQEYLEVRKQREQEAQKAREEQEMIEENPQMAALKEAVEEGERYIGMIRQANVEIQSEEMSRKLERLEDITRKIFEHIKKHPQNLGDLRKFMSYYLPTTLKLVHVYCELEKQPVKGDNITNAKADIEKTMDTINVAFENLLDDMFEETAMDVSTDISVLKTMLAQEGLTESELDSLKS